MIDFDNEAIVRELRSAKLVPGERKDWHYVCENKQGHQSAYISLCLLLVVFLMRRGQKSAEAQTRRYKKKLGSSFRGLWDLLHPAMGPQDYKRLSSQLPW
jgi:hypothetical protein